MTLEAQLAINSELLGVTNALLEKALTAMLTSVANSPGTQAAPAADPLPILATTPVSTPARRGRPPKAEAAAIAAAVDATPAAAVPSNIPATTFADVEAAIVRLATAKTRAKAEAVLGALGVTKCGELKASDYDKAIDAFNNAAKAA